MSSSLAPQAEATKAPSSPGSLLSPDFARHLKGLIGKCEPGSLQAGRVSIIGLDRVKERFGSSWSRLAERANRIARNTIERYMAPGDIFTHFGGTNFAIVFSSLDTERARMKCLLIADEVMKALLGEEDEGTDLISVGTAVAQLDGNFSLDDMMSADQPLDSHGGPGSGEPAQTAPAAADAAQAAQADVPHFTFRPMWDTENAVLSTYLCTAVDEANGRHGDDREAVLRLDGAMQECVLRELARVASEGCKVLVGLTVHYETLAAASHRRRYIQALDEGLPRDAERLLIIEIADIPEGVPQSRMYELTMPLTRCCRGLVARLRLESVDFSAFRSTKVVAVGCDVAHHPASELSIIQLMSRFNRAAEQAHVATYVRGLRSVSLAAAAVGAGFRYIDGSSIGDLVPHPTRIVKFNLHDVYRSLLPP